MKFLVLINKILKGKNLKAGLYCYAMTKDILSRELLSVSEHEYQEKRNKGTTNYELGIQVLMNHFTPQKALQLQKRNLCQGLLIKKAPRYAS